MGLGCLGPGLETKYDVVTPVNVYISDSNKCSKSHLYGYKT